MKARKRAQLRLWPRGYEEGWIVDLFAGGGGASVGLEAALGRPVDVAVNHNETAIAVHRRNHPHTIHHHESVWNIPPLDVTGGRPVSVLWASPDCTHFSRAKGGVPGKKARSKRIRALANVVVRWARDARPAVIFVENVFEFTTWGPLCKRTKEPIKARAGESFRRWIRGLQNLGYAVEWRVLDSSLYGAPTRRKRLFVVARCDGRPIVWPEPTHGPGKLPLHTAAECIDWSLPCPSIFERKKPLADKTMWRIAHGIRRFVLENPRPFIVRYNGSSNGWRGQDVGEPITTVDTSNRFGVIVPHVTKFQQNSIGADPVEPFDTIMAGAQRFGVVAPNLIKVNHGKQEARGEPVDGPLSTVTAERRGHGLVAAVLQQSGQGEREGQRARVLDVEAPLGTVVAGGQRHAMVSAFLSKAYGDPKRKGGGGRVVGSALPDPIGTVTARDHHGLVSAVLVEPGQRHGRGQKGAEEPLSTVMTKDRHALAAVALATFRGTDPSQPGSASVEAPMPTISAGGIHVGEVRAFLSLYYGNDGPKGQKLDEPMRTLRAKHCFGLVTVHGVDYQIVDIGFRMVEPHELKRAQYGRFAAGYDMRDVKTKAAQVRLLGNSVPPEMVEALVSANVPRTERIAA